ncbi:amidophosphoribosyltransferase [Segatella oris]|uniref:amidophosphoribosyltransferase n=1 Tax=Segatella oris TaxID=28135 RepID=UPI0002F8BE16|nr:amidophosphoribosyltransferase [Segatella oris]
MKNFTINGGASWYTNPETNNRQVGTFLTKKVQAYYHDDYHGGDPELRDTTGTVENIITTLKNQFKDKSKEVLIQAGKNMIAILNKDLPQILRATGLEELVVCAIPRSKAENTYTNVQLLFKKAIEGSVKDLDKFIDGTDYIVRHTDTRTTHMDKSGYGGIGNLPYPGITKDTCTISDKVRGKDILLIDDLYTASVNIDEDAIQALFDNGARSVTFYSLGKTIKRTQ